MFLDGDSLEAGYMGCNIELEDYRDIMTIEEFRASVKNGLFTDDDGGAEVLINGERVANILSLLSISETLSTAEELSKRYKDVKIEWFSK